MYGEQEREMDRLVASELVYLSNQFDKESQVMGMGYMYLGQEVPYKAAVIIDKGIKDEIIEPTCQNLGSIGYCLVPSKELTKALR